MHPKNCKGQTCLVGYIREYLYPDFEKSKNGDDFKKMMKELLYGNFPFENASWLRFQMKKQYPKIPIYELNPYTNVDELVKSILGLAINYIWADFGQTIANFAGMKKVKLCLISPTQVEFSADKISMNPHTMPELLCLTANRNKVVPLAVIENFETIVDNKKFTFAIPESLQKMDLCIKIDNQILLLPLNP